MACMGSVGSHGLKEVLVTAPSATTSRERPFASCVANLLGEPFQLQALSRNGLPLKPAARHIIERVKLAISDAQKKGSRSRE